MSVTIFFLIPILFVIVAIEWFVSRKLNDKRYTLDNVAMNLAIGAVDRLGSLFTMALLYFALDYVYYHFALFHFPDRWYQWWIGYIAVDFISYWYHRYSHEINILWAGHITHHSSSNFNLSNGFRTSVFQGLNRIPFWTVLPVFGFSPVVLIIIFNISGIYDFFMHTSYFPQNKWLEKIFITPSLHKVHHGKNKIYIDKNYGSTFSVWDRMFGTLQPEIEEVEFGVIGNYKDEKPLSAITYYYTLLFSAIKKTGGNFAPILFAHPSKNKHILSHSVKNISVKGTKNINLYSLALFYLISGIVIDFLSLVMKNNIELWEFFIFYGIGLVAIITATRIINNLVSSSFLKKQLIYSITASAATLLVFLFTGYNNSLFLFYYFLLLSVFSAHLLY